MINLDSFEVRRFLRTYRIFHQICQFDHRGRPETVEMQIALIFPSKETAIAFLVEIKKYSLPNILEWRQHPFLPMTQPSSELEAKLPYWEQYPYGFDGDKKLYVPLLEIPFYSCDIYLEYRSLAEVSEIEDCIWTEERNAELVERWGISPYSE